MIENFETSPSAAEHGFTIVELLVATAMMLVITAAATSMLMSSMQHQSKVTSRADQIGDARNAMVNLVNDLRQGSAVTFPTPTGMTLATYCDGASGNASPCTVKYACTQELGKSTYRCTRTIGAEPAKTVVTGLSSGAVFCYLPTATSNSVCGTNSGTPTPTYVGVRIELPASDGESATVLENGAALHNAPAYMGA